MSLLLIINNLVFALVMAAVAVALGARLRRIVRLAVAPGLRLAVDVCLGAWVAACLFLLMAVVGATHPLLWFIALCGLAAVGRWKRAGRRWSALPWATLGGLISLPVAAGPPFFYDAMVYHLGLPWQMLMEGGLRAHPENIFAAFPPLAQLLALPPLAFGFDRVPALLHWLSFLAAAAAVYALARRLGARPPVAGCVAFACLLPPVAALVPGFPAAEGWFLAPLLAAIALSISPHHRRDELLVGLLLGVAAAARLQAVGWTVLVLALLLWRRRSWRPLLGAAPAWLVGAAPWWLKNLLLLADPVAPVFWRREGLETLWRDAGALRLQGLTVLECLQQLPARLGPEMIGLLPLALLALLALRGGRDRRQLGALLMVALPLWLFSGALARFLLPVLAILLALAASTARSRATTLVTVAALLWCAGVGGWRSLVLLRSVRPAAGLFESTASATGRLLPNDPLQAFLAAEALPSEARVLLVGEPRCYSFPRAFVAPSQHDPSLLRGLWSQTTTSREAEARLGERGFSHLLVNWAELERLGRAYPVAPWQDEEQRQRFRALIGELQPPVVAHGSVRIYRLQAP